MSDTMARSPTPVLISVSASAPRPAWRESRARLPMTTTLSTVSDLLRRYTTDLCELYNELSSCERLSELDRGTASVQENGTTAILPLVVLHSSIKLLKS